MRAINHALTGALIGLTVGEPAIALPTALASHFVCDAIPHHGKQQPDTRALRSSRFLQILLADAMLCLLLIILLFDRQPGHWLLASTCAFVAAAPDLLWFKRFRSARDRKAWRPNVFDKFAAGIQWFQRPIGVVVELAWFSAAVALLMPFLR